MEFPYKRFEDEFSEWNEELEKAFKERDFLKTIAYLRALSLGYAYTNHVLSDDRMEEITKIISREKLGEAVIYESDPGTVVLYDSIGLFERVLAEIYIDSLERAGYYVVLLMHANATSLDRVRERYSGRKNVSIRLIPRSRVEERMRHIQAILLEIKPRHIFMHVKPTDVCGVGAISTVTGAVTRYMIDLTDHGFWIGKCASDSYIAFRNFGYNVAAKLRGIMPEKILMLPYYPNSREKYPFEGMPFDVEKHDYVFSGGWIYKIEGDEDHTYRRMVSYILDHHPGLNFVFAGNGTNEELDYLKKAYPGRFFHIPERKDLDEVLKHAKLYLGTYPVGGGLMTQYALKNRCIPLCLSKEINSCEDVSTLLLQPEKADFVFYQVSDLLSTLDRLLVDREYYDEVRSGLTGQVIEEKEFVDELDRVLKEGTTKFIKRDMDIDMAPFQAAYRNRANEDMFEMIIRNVANRWIKEKYSDVIEKWDKKMQEGNM